MDERATWLEPQAWARVLGVAERGWRLDDVLTEDAALDFERPLLPESLTGAQALEFLEPAEARTLGHIRAHGYLGLFGLVEEMILPFVLAHAELGPLDELDPVRALLRFASEEAKHIALFRRFSRVFQRGFGRPVPLVGPASAFVREVLAHSELGVALAVLHIEWMTQRHWLESVRGEAELEPAFRRLLRHHWLDESGHARLDALLVRQLAANASRAGRERGVDDYLHIVAVLDGALAALVELDRATLEAAIGRTLSARDAAQLQRRQHAAQRATFLSSGMTHPRFIESLREVAPDAPARVAVAERSLRAQP
jgi:hypothetical protein